MGQEMEIRMRGEGNKENFTCNENIDEIFKSGEKERETNLKDRKMGRDFYF